MGPRLVLALSLAVTTEARASDPDEFPVEETPRIEAPAVAVEEAPAAEVVPAAVEEAPVVEEPPAVAEEAPRKGIVPWVGRAATDVGDALSSAWRGVTGKKKASARAEAPAVEPVDAPEPEEIDAALAIPADPAPAAAEPVPPRPAEPECETREQRWRFHQHTLFGVKRRSGRFGPYIGGTGLFSEWEGGPGIAWGLEGGVVLGSHLVLGAAGYASGPFESGSHDVRFAYAGFQPGLVLWSGALLHPRFDVLLGSGAVFDDSTGRLLAIAPVAVPRLGAELNVSRALRLSGNLGWRFVGAPGQARDAFSGLEAGVTVRFGWM